MQEMPDKPGHCLRASASQLEQLPPGVGAGVGAGTGAGRGAGVGVGLGDGVGVGLGDGATPGDNIKCTQAPRNQDD